VFVAASDVVIHAVDAALQCGEVRFDGVRRDEHAILAANAKKHI